MTALAAVSVLAGGDAAVTRGAGGAVHSHPQILLMAVVILSLVAVWIGFAVTLAARAGHRSIADEAQEWLRRY